MNQKTQSPKLIAPFLITALILIVGGITFVFAHQVAANQTTGEQNATTATARVEKILVSISNNTTTWDDDTLYTIDPDGSHKTEFFDFHTQPKLTTGQIHAPRIGSNASQIYFHSEHAYIYTPARRNLFSLSVSDTALKQITPGANSGVWGQSGNSTISGFVTDGFGTPWGNAPVYLEGMDMVYTDIDGAFSFHNVPPGPRWLMAYRPALDAFDATNILVTANINVTGLDLVPNSTDRMNFEHPVPFNNRIYYSFINEIHWTGSSYINPQTVYTSPADSCPTLPTIDAFDAGPLTGRLAIYDYQEGCGIGNNNHNGIYLTDKDGNNKQLIVDILNAPNWNNPILPVEIFWSPNEQFIAVKAKYGGIDHLLVFNTSGQLSGFAYADTGSEVLTSHGWSPDGKWLLYSSYDGNPAQATLGKIGVEPSGSLDNTSLTILLTNQPISGATWGYLAVPQKVFLPIIIR